MQLTKELALKKEGESELKDAQRQLASAARGMLEPRDGAWLPVL